MPRKQPAPKGASDFREMLNNLFAERQETYQPNYFANIIGTYCVGEVRATFTEMLDLFSCPIRVNYGVEVNEWRFTGPGGTFTVYDSEVPSETHDGVFEFNIGAKSGRAGLAFQAWVEDKLAAYRASKSAKWVA